MTFSDIFKGVTKSECCVRVRPFKSVISFDKLVACIAASTVISMYFWLVLLHFYSLYHLRLKNNNNSNKNKNK